MIINGDCLEVMQGMDDNSIDTIITDPPYGLKFMGKRWDYEIPSIDHFTEMLRVAKPGAFLLCFGGTRTFHRIACNIEDAGWEIRDTMMWTYGSGFPKSLDISKAIDKAAGAEREVVGTYQSPENTTGFKGQSKGAVFQRQEDRNITAPATPEAKTWQGYGTALKPAYEPIIVAMKPVTTFAANALEWGVAGLWIDGGRVETGEVGKPREYAQREHRENWRITGGTNGSGATSPAGRFPANIILDEEAGAMLDEQSGGASRFFYCAKASKAERNMGCKNNGHPTVKPLALMEYLCKLTRTPSGGIVLDPYCGSGTTGMAAVKTGRDFIGIELDPDYCEIARRRIGAVEPQLEMAL